MLTRIDEILGNALKHIISADKINDIGLMRGKSGLILFLFYVSKHRQDENLQQLALKELDNLLSDLSDNSAIHTFASGVSGCIWLIGHLKKNLFIDIEEDIFDNDIKKYVEKALFKELHSNNFDFLHGSTGIIYAILEHENLHYLIKHYLDRLQATKVEDEEGIRWIFDNPPSYNISLSHGLSAIIVVLSKIYLIIDSIENKILITKLLEGCVTYLFNKKLSKDFYCIYPSAIYFNGQMPQLNSRLSWCYGDLGIAIALWQANKVLMNKKIEDEVYAILDKNALRKTFEETAIVDASFCHGSAGISYIYNKFYQETKKEKYKEISLYWLEETLNKNTFFDGIAGYKSFYGKNGWKSEIGLLEGVMGTSLCISSVLDNLQTNWDDIFLMS